MNSCERCRRLVPDGTTDFGGDPGLTLRPTCAGIEAVVRGDVVDIIAAVELRAFLTRTYGEPDPDVRRLRAALEDVLAIGASMLAQGGGPKTYDPIVRQFLSLARMGLGIPDA